MKKAKVNITLLNIEMSGGHIAVFEIANRLHELNYDVVITTLAGDHSWFPLKVKVNYVTSGYDTKFAKALAGTINVYRKLRNRGPSTPYFCLNSFTKDKLGIELNLVPYLAKHIPDCDINVATYYPTAFAVYYSGKGKPYYFLQSSPSLVAELGGFRRDYCLKEFEGTLRLPFHFLVNSGYTRDLLGRYQPDARVSTVGIGVNTRVFYPRKQKLFEDIKKPKVMLILGGLTLKGNEIALRVLNSLNKRSPVHALLVGSPKDIQKTFSSQVPEFTYSYFGVANPAMLATLFSSADLFLYTSYVETFGLPPLEAMACGTPVVSTDCHGNRDYSLDGYNLLLASPGDVATLTEASFKVLTESDLAEKLVEGGLETAKRFTWEKVGKRFEASFDL